MRPCTLRLPCCDGGGETTVFAHAPSVSKGLAQKSPNWWGAFACASCHDIVDHRVKHNYTQDFLAKAWLRGIHETQLYLFENGYLMMGPGVS